MAYPQRTATFAKEHSSADDIYMSGSQGNNHAVACTRAGCGRKGRFICPRIRGVTVWVTTAEALERVLPVGPYGGRQPGFGGRWGYPRDARPRLQARFA